MKANKVERKKSRSVLALVILLILAATGLGLTTAYNKLREIWIAQCVVTDVAMQAICPDGTMVKGDTILDRFGIKKGANLALIDFRTKRDEILRDIPNIRALSVTRHLPNRVTIQVEERQPVVRMGIHGQNGTTGRVADAEGIVFTCRRRTSMLPMIREKQTATTGVGHRLTGRSLAALQLIEVASDTEFSSLGILDVDIAKSDFILATLHNYAQAKIAWEGMDAPSEATRPSLTAQLRCLTQAIQSHVGSDAKTWNATIPNRIFADTQEKIL